MKVRIYILALSPLLLTGCLAVATSVVISDNMDESRARSAGTLQEEVIKANAAGTGYEMPIEDMDAMAHAVFEALDLEWSDCWDEFDGTAYCGIYYPVHLPYPDTWTRLKDQLYKRFNNDLVGALPLMPSWTKTNGVWQRPYVLDGMQIIRVYYTNNTDDRTEQFAMVFE